jgi:hypothetical protein
MMEIGNYSLFKTPDPERFFNRDGLDNDGLARIDRVISQSKATLNIADRLEKARDNIRFATATERNFNNALKQFGVRASLIDFRV